MTSQLRKSNTSNKPRYYVDNGKKLIPRRLAYSVSRMALQNADFYVESSFDVGVYKEALGMRESNFAFPEELCPNNREAVKCVASYVNLGALGIIDGDNDCLDESIEYPNIYMTKTRDWESLALVSPIGREVLEYFFRESKIYMDETQHDNLLVSIIDQLSFLGMSRVINGEKSFNIRFTCLRESKKVRTNERSEIPFLPCSPAFATISKGCEISLNIKTLLAEIVDLQDESCHLDLFSTFKSIDQFVEAVKARTASEEHRKGKLFAGHDLIWLLRYLITVLSSEVLDETATSDRFRRSVIAVLIAHRTDPRAPFWHLTEKAPKRVSSPDLFWVSVRP